MWPFANRQRRVLIVCTANICRSPAAAALLRFHLKRLGLRRGVAVDSAGTQVGLPGSPADPRMIAIAAEMGVKLRRHRARGVDEDQVRQSTHLWVMEASHREQLLDRWPDAAPRIALLHHQGIDLPDPYFGDKAGVRETFETLDAVCLARAEWLLSELAEAG